MYINKIPKTRTGIKNAKHADSSTTKENAIKTNGTKITNINKSTWLTH